MEIEETAEQAEQTEREDMTESVAQVASALRGPRQTIYYQLLTEDLVNATRTTNSLQAIMYICRAAMRTEKIAKVENVDYEVLKRLFKIANALLNPKNYTITRTNQSHDRINYPCVYVEWGIHVTEQAYNDYIKPWETTGFSHWQDLIRLHRVKAYKLKHKRIMGECEHVFGVYREEKLEEAEEKWKGTECLVCYEKVGKGFCTFVTEQTTIVFPSPAWSYFFEAVQYLTEIGFQTLYINFVNYAMPIIEEAKGYFSQTINPSIYAQTIKLLNAQNKPKGDKY